MLIDSHAHLLDRRYDDDRHQVIMGLPAQGLDYVIECASDMDTAIRAAALANQYHEVFAAVGIHPHDAKDWDEFYEKELRTLAAQKKVVAIGEIGLDYHYDHSPRDVQQAVFRKQIEIALDLNMPVVVHSREATEDVLRILGEYPALTGVIHSFSGSVETMRKLLEMGFYIGFGGMITFKNAKKPVRSATEVPLERLLVETDSPYLAPVPHRGERNTPAHTMLVAQKIADLKGIELQTVLDVTTQNAKLLFSLPV